MSYNAFVLAVQAGGEGTPRARASQTWAMLIKRVYEVDPLTCPHCGGTMKVVSFIEPPQQEVIEKILQHCGLWHASTLRPPPRRTDDLVHDGNGYCDEDSSAAIRELTYVDMDTFWATF